VNAETKAFVLHLLELPTKEQCWITKL